MKSFSKIFEKEDVENMRNTFHYPEIDTKKTGRRIRNLCFQKGLTVAQIQDFLFIGSNQCIYSWFCGRTLPKLDSLYALASLLEVTMDDLIVKVEEKDDM